MAKEKQPKNDLPKLTTLECLNAARGVVNAWEEWSQSDGPNQPWKGMTVKVVSQQLHMAIQRGCDATADVGKEVEPKAKRIVMIFDDLARAFIQWLRDASMGLDTAPPRGNADMHNAFERLRLAIKPSPFPKPDPIKQLMDLQRVSPAQIAVIYGWRNESNDPDISKVYEEYENPGTHFNPASWIHPAEKAMMAEIDAHWALREEPRGKMFAEDESLVATSSPEPQDNEQRLRELIEKGTVDEMFRAGSNVAQMTRFLRIEYDMLMMLAEEKGFVLVNDKFVSKEQLKIDEEAKKFEKATA
jgi:hypothetical protein